MRESESGVAARLLPTGGGGGVACARTSGRGGDGGGTPMEERAMHDEAMWQERASGVVARFLRLTAGDGGGVGS